MVFCDFHLMAGAFANIFTGKVESQILNKSAQKPFAWKRYFDDILLIIILYLEYKQRQSHAVF